MGLRAQRWKADKVGDFRPGGIYPVPHGLTGISYSFTDCASAYHFDRKSAHIATPIGKSQAETGARLRLQGEVITKRMPRSVKNVMPGLYDAFAIHEMDKKLVDTARCLGSELYESLKSYSELEYHHSTIHPFMKFAPKVLRAIPAIRNAFFMSGPQLDEYGKVVLELDESDAIEFRRIIKRTNGRSWKRNVIDKAIEIQILLAESRKSTLKQKVPPFDYGAGNSLAEALDGIDFRIRELPLEINLRRHFRVEHRAIEAGIVPRYMFRHPWGPVFDTIKKLKGGTVLIDNSGSMQLSVDEIVEMVRTAPLSTIAMYEGNRSSNIGYLTIVGKDGRCATSERIKAVQDGGHNIVDYHSLRWLCGMPEPRVWVSDQNVTAVNATRPAVYKTACLALVRQFGIYCAMETKRALELFKKLHKEKVVR